MFNRARMQINFFNHVILDEECRASNFRSPLFGYKNIKSLIKRLLRTYIAHENTR
ncbi:hypothetical protein SAMN05443253_104365 [Bacillus sp. OK048]|nr:hypothetical protein SAMN05443253_104365 [Bacillus sp. OK048]